MLRINNEDKVVQSQFGWYHFVVALREDFNKLPWSICLQIQLV